MVNSTLHAITTAELIVELQARGIDMTSAIEQMQAERKPQEKGKVILFVDLTELSELVVKSTRHSLSEITSEISVIPHQQPKKMCSSNRENV